MRLIKVIRAIPGGTKSATNGVGVLQTFCKLEAIFLTPAAGSNSGTV